VKFLFATTSWDTYYLMCRSIPSFVSKAADLWNWDWI